MSREKLNINYAFPNFRISPILYSVYIHKCSPFIDHCQEFFLTKMKKSEFFFTKQVDNGIMAKKKSVSVERHVRVPRWMDEAIQKIAEGKSYTYTEVVLDLLRQELVVMGYTMGIGREAVRGSGEEPADKRA
jgi:hypothetical protein